MKGSRILHNVEDPDTRIKSMAQRYELFMKELKGNITKGAKSPRGVFDLEGSILGLD